MTATNSLDGLARINYSASEADDVFGSGSYHDTTLGKVVWAKCAAATTEGQVVYFAWSTSVYTATLATTTNVSTTLLGIGVAVGSYASGEYGWFFVGPFTNVDVKLAASVSADTQVTTTATAGSGGTGGTNVISLLTNAASGSGGLTKCRATRSLAVASGA